MLLKKNNNITSVLTKAFCTDISCRRQYFFSSKKKKSKSKYYTYSHNETYFYNLFVPYKKRNLYRKKIKKFNLKNKDRVQKIILNINKTSFTLKSKRVPQYKILTCLGYGRKWIGLGEGKNVLFKKCFIKSVSSAKKHIYNLNFKCNDYRQLKYKGCKFKLLNMGFNKHNLKIYNDINKIYGNKKIKLISYSSKTPINIFKSLVNCCK